MDFTNLHENRPGLILIGKRDMLIDGYWNIELTGTGKRASCRGIKVTIHCGAVYSDVETFVITSWFQCRGISDAISRYKKSIRAGVVNRQSLGIRW